MSPRRPNPEKKQSGLPTWLVLAGIVAVALIVVLVGADFLSKAMTQTAVPTGPSSVSATGITRTGRTEGDPNAPINFVEYSDFQ
jgi:hypothetical protein